MTGPVQPYSPEIPDDGTLEVRAAFDHETFLLALYGDFDLAGVPEVERLLEKAESTDAAEIVVDLSGLHFIDSSGIRVLALAHARARRRMTRFALLRGPDQVQHVFRVCGLDTVLPFAD